MATDLYGYTSQEVLNKVLNESSSAFKVDIVSGAEYAEDSAHTSSDTGQFVLGVRNDTLAALGGSDGDYVPFQMNSSGAVYVDIADGGQFDTLLDTLETTLTSIETDAAAIETLITSTNTKLDTLETTANAQETLLTGIDADTGIKVLNTEGAGRAKEEVAIANAILKAHSELAIEHIEIAFFA